jgi:hypothetical protein
VKARTMSRRNPPARPKLSLWRPKASARRLGALLTLVTIAGAAANCASIASFEAARALPESAGDSNAGPARGGALAGPLPGRPSIAKAAGSQRAIEPGQVPAIALRLTAWGNHERYVDDIRERLRLRGYRLRDAAPDTLEIVLEESGTTHGFLRFLNLIATIGTGTLLPFYNQVNYHLTYRHFRDGVLQSACRYELRNNEFVSALLIPLAPFRWPTSVLAETFERTVDAYAYGCVALENLPSS